MQDALSKTVPVWAAVLNRAVAAERIARTAKPTGIAKARPFCSSPQPSVTGDSCQSLPMPDGSWDTTLHLPTWVPQSEHEQISSRLDSWVQQLQQLQVPILPASMIQASSMQSGKKLLQTLSCAGVRGPYAIIKHTAVACRVSLCITSVATQHQSHCNVCCCMWLPSMLVDVLELAACM